jgi:hypothetical protein
MSVVNQGARALGLSASGQCLLFLNAAMSARGKKWAALAATDEKK